MIRIKNTRGLSAEIFSGTSPEMLCHNTIVFHGLFQHFN
jgi:hypothetical protein